MVLNTGAPSRPLPVSFYIFFRLARHDQVRISLAGIMITPPIRCRNPFALWLGSWLFKDSPTCTTPNPSTGSSRWHGSVRRWYERSWLITDSGSPAANTVVVPTVCNKNQCHIKPHPFLLLSPHRHRVCHFPLYSFFVLFFSCEKFLQYTSLQSIRKTAIHQGCPR